MSNLPLGPSFPERADLAKYALDLEDMQLSKKILSPSFCSSPHMARRLSQLHARLPNLCKINEQTRNNLLLALKKLLAAAADRYHPIIPEYGVQVELVMLYLKEIGKERPGEHTIIWMDGENEQDVYHAEKAWLCDWVDRFQESTGFSSTHKEQVIYIVVHLYSRIKRAGSTYGDAQRQSVYKLILYQEGEYNLTG
ncbi:hypothetical protein FGB62_88g015 [Gracilaria domingensis]|nr:hypothetical protein FGB62_88g015 [Gracilaria domingensis]